MNYIIGLLYILATAFISIFSLKSGKEKETNKILENNDRLKKEYEKNEINSLYDVIDKLQDGNF